MIHLALHFDDPFTTSDHALKYGIFAAAKTAGIPLSVEVVPFHRQDGWFDPTFLFGQAASHNKSHYHATLEQACKPASGNECGSCLRADKEIASAPSINTKQQNR